jgi:hypothetical protein
MTPPPHRSLPEPPPDRCPLCGGDNRCTMAGAPGSSTCGDCWCAAVRIDEGALTRVPATAIGKACLCRRCATGDAGDGVQDVGRARD